MFQEIAFEAICITDSNCNMCESSFSSNERAVTHYKEIHLHCSYICGLCTKYFSKKEKFESHYSDEHSDSAPAAQPIEMPIETSIISERPHFRRVQLISEFNKKRCLDCDIHFATFAEINEHFEATHFRVCFCQECDRGFVGKKSLSRHKCNEADKSRLSKTRSMMYDVRNKRCSRCKLTFKDITELQDHFLLQHRFKIFKCKKCAYVTSIEHKLKQHHCRAMPSSLKGKKQHHSQRKLKNRLADHRTPSSINGLKTRLPKVNASTRNRPIIKPHHVRTMMKDFRAKRCACCELTFTKSTECHDHFSQQHQLRILECKKCDLLTSVESIFKHHSCRPLQSTSASKKPHQLPEKSSILANRGDKISMMWDARAMRCSRCELEFTDSAECYDHLLLQHQFKVFSCKKCDYATSVIRLLENHSCQTSQSTGVQETPLKNRLKDPQTLSLDNKKSMPSNGMISPNDCNGNGLLGHEPSTSGITSVSHETNAKATPAILTFDLSDSESDTAPDMISAEDSDVEILEWNHSIDVKPVIGLLTDWE